ncbi:MAG: hypothetical protein RL031_684 [Actinomycetota bacterium]|jgi:hypothetical protein
MKKLTTVLASLCLSTFVLVGVYPATATDIPMTIDGVINCAHPDNAITTTCRGEAPPAPVNTPAVPTTAPAPSAPAESSAPQVPLTIDGVINCAHPDNSITTTCWDLAQAAKREGATPSTPQLDCNLEIYKNYPVCTGVAPQAVIDSEKSKANAAPLPAVVDCADPMLAQTGACTNRTTTDLPEDCLDGANKNLPRCQPMTLPDGSINCAQPDNAVTTTCWEQSAALKSAGAITAIDCALPGYSVYPACTGVRPLAVLEFEKSSNTVLPSIEPAFKSANTETITAVTPISEDVEEGNKINGSVELKSRSAKTTVLALDIDASKTKVRVVATKKGSKTLSQTVSTDADGEKSVKFDRNLKGYTIRIIVDGVTIDSLKVK